MTKLNDRPVRPRKRADRPSYPRKLSLGAVALMTAMASTAAGCANLVETAQADDGGDDTSWIDLDRPNILDGDNWDDPDGDYAGGIGEEWVEEGGGGAGGTGGGETGGAGGEGAGEQGGGWAS